MQGKLNTAHPDGAPAQRRRLMSASNSTYESRVPRRGPESIPPKRYRRLDRSPPAGTGAMRTECRVETCSGTPLSCAFSRCQLPAWSYTHRCASRVASLALAVHIAQTGHLLGGDPPSLVHGDSIWPERASLWSMHGQPQRAKWLSPRIVERLPRSSIYNPPTESSKRSPRSAPKHTPKYQP